MTVDREAATPTVAELEQLLLDAKLSVPQPRPGSVSRAELIETARASDCRVVGVTAPAGYGKSTLLAEWARAEDRPRRVGVARPLRRRSRGPAHLAGVRVRSGLAGQRRPDRRHGRSRRVGVGTRCAAPGLGVPDEPGSVRAHAGRPSRAAVAGLSRRAERGDLGDPARLATGRGESFRAAPPAAAAGVG